MNIKFFKNFCLHFYDGSLEFLGGIAAHDWPFSDGNAAALDDFGGFSVLVIFAEANPFAERFRGVYFHQGDVGVSGQCFDELLVLVFADIVSQESADGSSLLQASCDFVQASSSFSLVST